MSEGQNSEAGDDERCAANHISSPSASISTKKKKQKKNLLLLSLWCLSFGLPAQTKRNCSKNRSPESGCCCHRNPVGNRLHLITAREYQSCSACPWKIPPIYSRLPLRLRDCSEHFPPLFWNCSTYSKGLRSRQSRPAHVYVAVAK